MAEFITFGETMAVMAPCEVGKIGAVKDFSLRIAGAESNTAIGVSRLGHSSLWLSAVGNDPFGEYIKECVSNEEVDVSEVKVDPLHRTGMMFKEFIDGKTTVYYYRENSALANFSPSDIDERIFDDAKILHLSGITPKLSESARNSFYKLLSIAREREMLVSFDPNIRRKIWGNKDYTEELRNLCLSSSVALLGLGEAKELSLGDEPREIAKRLANAGVKFSAVKDGDKGAYVSCGRETYFIPPIKCNSIDPVGAGDGFNAGFISGLLEGRDILEAGRMGAVVGALATETVGDVDGYPSRVKLEKILEEIKNA